VSNSIYHQQSDLMGGWSSPAFSGEWQNGFIASESTRMNEQREPN
jgi:hypothetical protein